MFFIITPQARGASASQSTASTGSREFLMSCSYGILAGTLVGTASLAFEQQPGEKLYRIARGASLGLYAGILLGWYVMYVVPAQMEQQRNERIKKIVMSPPQFDLSPTVNPNTKNIDGALATANIFNF